MAAQNSRFHALDLLAHSLEGWPQNNAVARDPRSSFSSMVRLATTILVLSDVVVLVLAVDVEELVQAHQQILSDWKLF